jgi:hypothetical protein
MRQKDFSAGRTRARLRNARLFTLLTTVFDFDVPLVATLRAVERRRRARMNLDLLQFRSLSISGASFNLNAYDDATALRNFRFRVHEIGRCMVDFMGWSPRVRTSRNRYRCDATTATCIVLRRLATPFRWEDVELEFGMRASALSEVFWEAIESAKEKRASLLTDFRYDLMDLKIEEYSEALGQMIPLNNCVGFIDCTKIQVSRLGGPSANQRALFSGHKRFHCFSYQSITTPDGLVFHMHGPEDGRRHDTTLYRKSEMNQHLSQSLTIHGDPPRQFCIYGDGAYILRPWLQVGFSPLSATPEQLLYNAEMSAVRVAVEWSYKDVKAMWTTQDFKRKLKVRESPVAVLYIMSALLWNCKVCLQHGSQAGSKFQCDPPSFSQYTRTE